MWISTSDCTFPDSYTTDLKSKAATPLFIPTINNATASASQTQVVITFSGDLVVPCDLYVNISLTTWELVPLSGTPGESSAIFILGNELYCT